MKRRLAVRGIFVCKGQLLCVKHRPYEGRKVAYWCVAGGGVDPGEPLINALKREIIEETGIKPEVGRLLYIQQFIKSEDTEEIEFFFEIKNSEKYTNIDLSKTSHGAEEIESIEYIDPSNEDYNVLPEFLRTIDLDNLPSSTVFHNYM